MFLTDFKTHATKSLYPHNLIQLSNLNIFQTSNSLKNIKMPKMISSNGILSNKRSIKFSMSKGKYIPLTNNINMSQSYIYDNLKKNNIHKINSHNI